MTFITSSSDSDSDSSYYETSKFRRLRNKMRLAVDREVLSETMWKWRCKLKGGQNEKTLSDFESSDTTVATAAGEAGAGAGGPTPKNTELGSTPSVKTMFEGPNSRGETFDWVDYPPKQLSKSAAKAQDRVAIKVFKVKDAEKPIISGRYSLRYHMIEVQNPLLVTALSKILQKQDIHIDVNETATFHYPFRSLYFGYDDMVAKYRDLKDDEPVKQFMLLLIKLLDDIFAETRAKISSLGSSGLTSFALAWTLFPRDSTVISWGNNCELLCKVSDTAYTCVQGIKYLIITGRVLRFTGRAFQWEDCQLDLKGFAGNKRITELAAYPLDLHDKDPAAIMARCAARGKKVLDYQGLTYVNYSGIALHRDGEKKMSKLNVDGRVLIDVVGYNKHHLAKGVREGTDPQTKKDQVVAGGDEADSDADDEDNFYRPPTGPPHPQGGPGPRHGRPSRPQGSTAPPPPSNSKAKRGGKRLSANAQERNKKAMLAPKNEKNLMYMAPLIEGYALKNKIWVSFYIEDISPLVWNDAAYDHLVYDDQQKDLVMSFVENHQGSHISTLSTSASSPRAVATVHRRPKLMDVIAGKGEGLIMLLSGPPGTGKTLMAEAVADRTHRPLFYLQAEDLGTNAAQLGANVKKVFEMATEWDAVILLDEADVFMAERHPQDILRNELVSIFLRELEYFRGIIFLTTNLYSTIDSAFRSRVSLHLLFNPLSPDARLIVWRKFLERLAPAPGGEGEDEDEDGGNRDSAVTVTDGAGDGATFGEGEKAGCGEDGVGEGSIVTSSKSELTEDDLKELAAWNLNGREIKTAVKMVRSWCDYKGYEMTLSRLESGIKVTSPHASKTVGGNDTSLYDE